MPTVGAGQAVQIMEGLERMGAAVDRAQLCRAAELDPADLARPGARIPVAAFERLVLEAERTTGDPLACLHAAEASGARGILSYLALAQPTLEDAILAFGRYAVVAGNGLRADLDRGPTHARVRVTVGSDHSAFAASILEHAVGPRGARAPRGGHPRNPAFRGPLPPRAPRAGGEAERVLGAPVRYGQPDCAIVLPAGDLSRRLGRANTHIARVLEAEASQQLALAAPREVAAQAAEAARRELLEGGDPDLEGVARTLGMSARTLQRRLRDESTSFRAIRDGVRRELRKASFPTPPRASPR